MRFYKEEEFKETEIGKIPKDWEVAKLGDVANIAAGGLAPQGEKYYKGGKYPFIRVQHIHNEYFKVVDFDLITDEAVKVYRLKLFPEGTIVFPKTGATVYLEKRALLPFNAYIVSHLCAVLSKHERVLQKYLFYSLLWKKIARKKESGYPTINLSEIKEILIPLPPLPEQQNIAKVLDEIQQAIELQDRIIEKTKSLKKALMQKLLTEGLYGEEPKETEIGKIPKSWEVVRLREVAEVVMGQSPPSSSYNTKGVGLPFLQGKAEFGDVYPSSRIYCDKPLKISEVGDILISVRAPVGDVNIAPFKLCIGRGLAALRFNSRFSIGLFYFYYLQKIKSSLEMLGKGSTFKAVVKDDLENLKLPSPPLAEQQKIAEILSTVDSKIELERKQREKLERIKRGLMALLLTGKIRVKEV